MKKAGIITYFYYYNYGTMLQGYALCRLLNRLGTGFLSADIIDCRFGEKKLSLRQLISVRIRRLFVYFTQLNKIYKLTKYDKLLKLKRHLFDDFVKDCCILSAKKYPSSFDLEAEPPKYDVYFTGSDQTWSPKVGLRNSLFIGFAPDDSIRAAYAPSIGVVSFTKEQRNFVKEKLSKYQYVSCRERYGSELLQDLSPVKVETVLDPTLVLTAEEWRQIEKPITIKGDYILCYFIGDKPYYRLFAKQLSSQLGLPLVFIPVSYVDFSDNDNILWETGPREFLSLIDHAKVVLTDSFHGTIFSINFNKTFYSFVKHAGLRSMDNMRIVDILERLGLLERLKESYISGEIAYSTIDYAVVNSLLEKERKKSESFLKKIVDAVR